MPEIAIHPLAGAARPRGGALLLLVLVWQVAWIAPIYALVAGIEENLAYFGLGICAWVFLLTRLTLRSFTSFEWRVGMRILGRENPGRWLAYGPWICLMLATIGVAVAWAGAPQSAGGLALEVVGITPVRLGSIALVVVSTLLGLVLTLARYFSVFGTTSISGVIIGVAALVVVQSVATGFQNSFENSVLSVYAHINVTRASGISDYRRFESWLRNLDGVTGVSPYVYHHVALAPERKDASEETGVSVIVKGIEPESASGVIDLAQHLERGTGRPVPLETLTSHYVPEPVPLRDLEWLPEEIAAQSGPLPPSLAELAARDPLAEPVGAGRKALEERNAAGEDDWIDPPMVGDEVAAGDIDRRRLPTVFIGHAMAKELSLNVGDVVRLVNPAAAFDRKEVPQARFFAVAGIFHAGFQEYDTRMIFVNIRELQRLRNYGQDIVSGIDLRLADRSRAPEIGAKIRDALGGRYQVLEWQELNDNLFSSIRDQKNLLTILMGLVMIVATFNVVSALWTMVVRRTSEIAILMSMGATGSQVSRVFQTTGVVIGAAGSLAGVAFGLVMCELVHLYGYTLDPEVYFIENLPVEVSVHQLVLIWAFATVASYLATLPPSFRAARLRPVEGLRYE
jgi:lipoprotein-releasing system permease protein